MDTADNDSKRSRIIRRKRWIIPVLLAFAIGTVGSSAAFGAPPPPKVAHPNPKASYETSLNKKLYDRLVTIPWYNVFDNIEYKVQGTKVTLTGQVLFPLSRSSVEGYVKGIPGVTRIVNHIRNLPVSSFDNQIRRAEYRSLFSFNSPLFQYSLGVTPQIHIIVDNGHVTLVGVVGNQMDREIAGMRARTVPDVFSVKNDLTVA